MTQIDYKTIAPTIANNINANTLSILNGRKEIDLSVLGAESQFTQAIDKKCEKIGIKRFPVYPVEAAPFIVDLEDSTISTYKAGKNDIDACIDNSFYHMSCDAEACARIIGFLSDYENAHVGIVGRGHAVLGLANQLLAWNYTVTQCHSMTKDVNKAVSSCDVIVYAVPMWEPFDVENRFVLDVGYSVPRDLKSPKIIHNVGMVTTSLIVNRAARRCMAIKQELAEQSSGVVLL